MLKLVPCADGQSSAGDGHDRAQKLARLGRCSRVSMNGMVKLIDDVKDAMPEHFSRRTQGPARKTCCSEATPYGPLVRQIEVGDVSIPIHNPLPLLWKSSEFAAFQWLLRRACLEGKLNIVIYADGITPQDGLSKHD